MDILEIVKKAVDTAQTLLRDERVIAGAAHLQELMSYRHPLIDESTNPLLAAGEILDAVFLGKLPHQHEYGQPKENIEWRQALKESGSYAGVFVNTLTPYVPLTAYSFTEGSSTQPRKITEKVNEGILQQMVWSNPSLLPKEAQTYTLEEFEVNKMIIFNHTYVLGFPEDRLGTEKDVEALNRTFGKYCFAIEEFINKPKVTLFSELKKFAESDFSKVGCIAVVILSHGGSHGYIYAEDDSYHESELTEVFQCSKNSTLFGKPLIFIIQRRLTNDSNEKSFDQACRTDDLVTDNRNMGDYSIPIQADTLVLHSTYHGQVSVRNIYEGSWFIQELCNKIEEHDSEDLQSIIIRVLRSIAYYKQFTYRDKNTKENVIYKQMPMCTTTLTRKLFLIRRYKESITCEKSADEEKSTSETSEQEQENCNQSTDAASLQMKEDVIVIAKADEEKSNLETSEQEQENCDKTTDAATLQTKKEDVIVLTEADKEKSNLETSEHEQENCDKLTDFASLPMKEKDVIVLTEKSNLETSEHEQENCDKSTDAASLRMKEEDIKVLTTDTPTKFHLEKTE